MLSVVTFGLGIRSELSSMFLQFSIARKSVCEKIDVRIVFETHTLEVSKMAQNAFEGVFPMTTYQRWTPLAGMLQRVPGISFFFQVQSPAKH